MSRSELSHRNFKRISVINWLLSVPLIFLFAWPNLLISKTLSIDSFFAYPGALLFSIPFMITILHGHVTMALGTAHRHHYYEWLADNPLTFGLFFHPMFMRTRFRLIMLVISFLILITGYFVT